MADNEDKEQEPPLHRTNRDTPEQLEDGTLAHMPDGTPRLTIYVFDHSKKREYNIGPKH